MFVRLFKDVVVFAMSFLTAAGGGVIGYLVRK
jgi:hypothetical protein